MPCVWWKQAVRRLPFLFLLVVVVVVVTAAFRPPPTDQTRCGYESDLSACTRVIESGSLKGFELASIYWFRASIWKQREEYGRAIADYREAVRLAPKDDSAPESLAVLYEKLGNYSEAEAFYKRSLALNKNIVRAPPMVIGLARVCKAQAKHAQAETHFKRALKMYEADARKNPNDNTPIYGLADLYLAWGNYGKAEPLYQRLLAMREKEVGTDHTFVAAILEYLASVHQARGKYAEAEALYRRALTVWETDAGGRHDVEIAKALDGLAGAQRAQGQQAQAEELYQRALALREARFGKDHTSVAGTLDNLAKVYEAQGKQAEAQAARQRAASIWEKRFGKDHPNVTASRGATETTRKR